MTKKKYLNLLYCNTVIVCVVIVVDIDINSAKKMTCYSGINFHDIWNRFRHLTRSIIALISIMKPNLWKEIKLGFPYLLLHNRECFPLYSCIKYIKYKCWHRQKYIQVVVEIAVEHSISCLEYMRLREVYKRQFSHVFII